jgi:hypothetical protein
MNMKVLQFIFELQFCFFQQNKYKTNQTPQRTNIHFNNYDSFPPYQRSLKTIVIEIFHHNKLNYSKAR